MGAERLASAICRQFSVPNAWPLVLRSDRCSRIFIAAELLRPRLQDVLQ
jgi:hypothetical protein